MINKINNEIEKKQDELKSIYHEIGIKCLNGDNVDKDCNKARRIEGQLEGLEIAADLIMEDTEDESN